jgi:hypothetical protein
MSDTMIDRIARSLCVSAGDNPDGATCDVYVPGDPDAGKVWASYRASARAVLVAMRQPTSAMLKAGEDDMNPWSNDVHLPHIWETMINAALTEQE